MVNSTVKFFAGRMPALPVKSFFMLQRLFFPLLLLSLFPLFSTAEDSPDNEAKPPFSFTGYVEPYYAYDFGQPDNHNRPFFLYSYNRHNEVNLNLGLLRGAYLSDRLRANLGLMAGTYSVATLAAEPGVFKNLFEANMGVKVSKKSNFWLDAGVFVSHIGFESAIGKDCWTLTRSLSADNSPAYESGAKLTYTTKDDKWLFSGLLLNGWMRIYRPDGNNTPAFGTQITFKPSDAVTLNSSSFIGNDKPDDAKQMRYFHDFYGIFNLSDAVGLTLGFDVGSEETADREDMNLWYSPLAILRFAATDKVAFVLRGEYYSDKNGVIIPTGTPNGFQTIGYSLNVDYTITDNAMWRTELRGFSSEDEIFIMDNAASKQNLSLTTSLAMSF